MSTKTQLKVKTSTASAFRFLLLFLSLRCFLCVPGQFDIRIRIKIFNSISFYCPSTSYFFLSLNTATCFFLIINLYTKVKLLQALTFSQLGEYQLNIVTTFCTSINMLATNASCKLICFFFWYCSIYQITLISCNHYRNTRQILI